MFWDAREWLVAHEGLLVDTMALLIAVLREHVIPRLDPAPRVEHVRDCRNPLRAVTDEGDWIDEEDAPPSWPEVATVPRAAVLSLARSIAVSAAAGDALSWATRHQG